MIDETDRLWAKVNFLPGMKACWEWAASKNPDGYGHFQVFRRGKWRSLRAHRIAYEQSYGEIPAGLIVRHRCDNPRCVRPDHLELGTTKDNVRDLYERGTPWRAYHNTVKTHCPHGHEYTVDNTYVYKGRRNCRMCIKVRWTFQNRKRPFLRHYKPRQPKPEMN